MNSKKIFLIASATLMLIAAFLPWFIYEASYSMNIAGIGGMSAQSTTESIPGYYIGQSYLAILIALGAGIAAFTRFKYSIAFGVTNLLIGAYTALFWKGAATNLNFSIQQNGVKADSSFSLAIGLWLFFGASLAYSIVASLLLFPATKQPELAYESPQANNYAAEVVTSENRFKKALIVALCLGVVVIAGLTMSIMKLTQDQATLAKAAVSIEATAPTKEKDDPVQALQTLAGSLSKTQPELEATTTNTPTDDGRSGIHHYGEEEGDYGSGEYSFASTRELTTTDIANLSKFQLKIMRNEIFARHGYIFKAPDLQEYFSTKYWYHPQYADISDMITPLEKTNIDFIKRWE